MTRLTTSAFSVPVAWVCQIYWAHRHPLLQNLARTLQDRRSFLEDRPPSFLAALSAQNGWLAIHRGQQAAWHLELTLTETTVTSVDELAPRRF